MRYKDVTYMQGSQMVCRIRMNIHCAGSRPR
jgi:hypothetical protein